ncbi:MAG TPA: hypothetical protein VH476_09915 [Solirubrobacterales bacterium]
MKRNGKRIAASAAVLAVVGSVVTLAGAIRGSGDPSIPATFHPRTFSWLQPGATPRGWSASRLPGSPARLPVPPGWRGEAGDPGTRTEALRTPSGEFAGYLNATPRQGSESAGNWSEFRLDHNVDEGDREVRLLAGATDLRFRSGAGSCVLDSYLTDSGNRYREVACIVSGPAATTVIVGAAAPHHWAAEAPTIEQAINSFTT